jgi:16S rRNA (adenine1518-N6/adenine1519-N6)-dimethyltransferase
VTESVDPIDLLPPLRTIIARHGLDARKSLGQHFLLDLNLTTRIARAAGDLSVGSVIEVGPVPGGLTRALLGCGAARVIVIERDPRCIDALAELRDAAQGRLEIIAADAREIDIATLGAAPRRIVANLPYNIATPLLIDWLTNAQHFAGMTLMFQREVADRIVAQAGEAAYGRLSVIANWRCRTVKLLNLPARAFTPAPKVASSVIGLTPYDNLPHPAEQAALEAVTAAAFGQRRKMLRGALKSLKVDPLALLESADIAPTARAETVDIAGFAALARAYAIAATGPDAIP